MVLFKYQNVLGGLPIPFGTPSTWNAIGSKFEECDVNCSSKTKPEKHVSNVNIMSVISMATGIVTVFIII